MKMFSRWLKELRSGASVDDLTAAEGYLSLTALEKLEQLRAGKIVQKDVSYPSHPAAIQPAVSGLRLAPIVTIPTLKSEQDLGDDLPLPRRAVG